MKITEKRRKIINKIKEIDLDNFLEIKRVYSDAAKEFGKLKTFDDCVRQAYNVVLANGSIASLGVCLKRFALRYSNQFLI